uniref:AVL9/DENND6 domain-containing protein n=1 Tax=Timema tahoe TaxID=61484 RepID=A0A7R9IS99_9NEOP|nr:unnamed protein product [Timema tahoe]
MTSLSTCPPVQVEFSFPPLIPGSEPDSNTCPPGWKYLPTLALPDGSHNFEADTVYFHLPSLTNPKQTVYGISCFRQIPVEGWFAKFLDKVNTKHSGLQESRCAVLHEPSCVLGHWGVLVAVFSDKSTSKRNNSQSFCFVVP